ncbi:MAG: hypothetical protein NTW87_21535, partial [Planctomycetota bacterium]|nr:hypothetical protein [Planctomycetota bacterium]
MIRPFALPLCAALTVLGLAGVRGASEEALKLGLKTNRADYLEHEPILAEWTISNTSAAPVSLFDFRSDFIQVVGTDQDGKKLASCRPLVSWDAPTPKLDFCPFCSGQAAIFAKATRAVVPLTDVVAKPCLPEANSPYAYSIG